jgi:hypothetical protein
MTVCTCTGICTCGTQAIIVTVGQGGPKGRQGVQGAQGIAGAYAAQGIQGPQGPSGGVQGAQGVQGVQGATGVGTQGATGTGTQGVQGIQGTTGTQGTTGAGTQGVQGLQGRTGVQGVAGGGVTTQQLADAIAGASLDTTDDLSEGATNKYFTVGRVSYIHTQGVASSTWTINHNLGFYPNLTVQDSAGTIYEGEINYTNTGSLTVTFSSAFSGKAYLS